jgi:hypothetical protein
LLLVENRFLFGHRLLLRMGESASSYEEQTREKANVEGAGKTDGTEQSLAQQHG